MANGVCILQGTFNKPRHVGPGCGESFMAQASLARLYVEWWQGNIRRGFEREGRYKSGVVTDPLKGAA